MTQEAIREIIRRQREFFYTGATLNIDFRIEALKKLQASIQAHQCPCSTDEADGYFK